MLSVPHAKRYTSFVAWSNACDLLLLRSLQTNSESDCGRSPLPGARKCPFSVDPVVTPSALSRGASLRGLIILLSFSDIRTVSPRSCSRRIIFRRRSPELLRSSKGLVTFALQKDSSPGFSAAIVSGSTVIDRIVRAVWLKARARAMNTTIAESPTVSEPSLALVANHVDGTWVLSVAYTCSRPELRESSNCCWWTCCYSCRRRQLRIPRATGKVVRLIHVNKAREEDGFIWTIRAGLRNRSSRQ